MLSTNAIMLTGAIGTGKSTACAYFKEQGIYCTSFDKIYWNTLQYNNTVFSLIKERFGEDCLLMDTFVDIHAFQALCAATPENAAWFTQSITPIVVSELKAHVAHGNSPYQIADFTLGRQMVTADIIKHRARHHFDFFLYLYVSPDIHYQRLKKTRKLSHAEAAAIVKEATMLHTRLIDHVDLAICNDGEVAQLHQALTQAHQALLSRCY